MLLQTTRHSRGFSLIELSIVLVILGLLTGGVLAGRHLIHAASLQSVIREYSDYQLAVNIFQEKYNAFPGDMANATRYWGRADNGSYSGQCAAPASNTGSGKQTCNGDGNGYIEGAEEHFRFWQHLANAELISGTYTGVTGQSSHIHHVIGVNCPASKFASEIGWGVRENLRNFVGTNGLWEKYPSQNLLRMGGETTGILSGAVFTTEDSWNIDKKIDDGKPAKGRIWSRTWSNCTTAEHQTDYNADYNLNTSGKHCAMFLFLH